MTTALSILIPSIPSRLDKLSNVMKLYSEYIMKYNLHPLVEIVSIVDNRKRSIGQKRNDLVDIAKGQYWVMSDEDDQLTERYFELILPNINLQPDVITYLQSARINDDKSIVKFGLKNINEDFIPNGTTNRPAWHCCTWRTAAVREARFADKNWGEDDLFQRTANELAQVEIHIPEVCHVYEHDSNLTTACQ